MRVLIACGGTAGHIFPGVALAEVLKGDCHGSRPVIIVSTRLRDRRFIESACVDGIDVDYVYSAPLPYKVSFEYIFFAFKLLRSLLGAVRIVLKYKPQIIVGFGGYVSFTPVIIGRILRIPVIIHEQNIVPGKANQYLARVADRVAVSFEDTCGLFPRVRSGSRVVTTGFPLRRHIVNDYVPVSRKDGKKITILVSGGSQGASSINKLFIDCLSQMDRVSLDRLHLIHSAGKKDYCEVKKRYEEIGVSSQVFDFIQDMSSAYRKADLLIARSGAGTIFEAAVFGIVCIFIPYAYGTAHQKENAFSLERNKAALVLDEGTVSAESLKKTILDLLDNSCLREELSTNIRKQGSLKAVENLLDELHDLYRGYYV